MTTVAIIGAGPLGRWLALGAARAGFRVLLEDVMPASLHNARESICQEFGRHELSPEALPAVAFVSSIEDAVREADLVIDCVPDELESKLEILWLVDRMAPPRTVIATPTMNLSIAGSRQLHLPAGKVRCHCGRAGGTGGGRGTGDHAARRSGGKRGDGGSGVRFLGEAWVQAGRRAE